MTYSSFDPSKVQIDSASNLGNLTDRINQEEIAEAQKPTPQPELDEKQQKKAAEEEESKRQEALKKQEEDEREEEILRQVEEDTKK